MYCCGQQLYLNLLHLVPFCCDVTYRTHTTHCMSKHCSLSLFVDEGVPISAKSRMLNNLDLLYDLGKQGDAKKKKLKKLKKKKAR